MELAKRRQYRRSQATAGERQGRSLPKPLRPQPQQEASRHRTGDYPSGTNTESKRCYHSHRLGHVSRDYPSAKTEFTNRGWKDKRREGDTSRVQVMRASETQGTLRPLTDHLNILACLFSLDSDDLSVCQVRIFYQGSKQQYVIVQVEGVPAHGIIGSRSEITIIGGELFCHIAAVARLPKSKFQKPDKILRTYDQRTFVLDGKMDLNICLDKVIIKTPVMLKQMPQSSC